MSPSTPPTSSYTPLRPQTSPVPMFLMQDVIMNSHFLTSVTSNFLSSSRSCMTLTFSESNNPT
uniref:Putative ovule protein n=1 Tax=Solanum chacoense TaxID=4108 RepID=A0A0V0HG55_SOLCH